jgi:hypothetical protein
MNKENMAYTYNSAIKKKEILPFVTSMNLEHSMKHPPYRRQIVYCGDGL